MGIQVEFNPDLALRDWSYFKNGERKKEECIPTDLKIGEVYNFLKKGQRNYYLLNDEPIPLIKTKGNQILSRPFAAIRILEATHFNQDGEIWTKGKYKVLEIYDINNPEIHFEGFLSVKN
ncbi:MAG TPA: hypothetical protein ENJ27_02210 [Candidatus Moranbacteria bacterium]|nr:hypothetical protein [Candidatus Moranbacteria bacterium]